MSTGAIALHLVMKQATGLMSRAIAFLLEAKASIGVTPEPANGSKTMSPGSVK